jgi:hypothetical protein
MNQPDRTQRVERQNAQQEDAGRMSTPKPHGNEHEHETERINRLTGSAEKQRLQPVRFEEDSWHPGGDHPEDESRMVTPGLDIFANEILIRLDRRPLVSLCREHAVSRSRVIKDVSVVIRKLAQAFPQSRSAAGRPENPGAVDSSIVCPPGPDHNREACCDCDDGRHRLFPSPIPHDPGGARNHQQYQIGSHERGNTDGNTQNPGAPRSTGPQNEQQDEHPQQQRRRE